MVVKIENSTGVKWGITKRLAPSIRVRATSMPLKYIRNENGDYVCPHPGCGFTKRNQSSMHYHMKKHIEQLDHICKICKKQFLQKQTLDLHIRSKHPEHDKTEASNDKKFICPINDCEFSALTKGNCIVHFIRVHCQDEAYAIMHKNSETKMMECQQCGDEFGSSSAFMYHVKGCLRLDNDKNRMLQSIIM